ncbi:MAG TPA: hypothetical protein VGM87_16500 [Roseomonas sp.]|jgi:hypothetical protein
MQAALGVSRRGLLAGAGLGLALPARAMVPDAALMMAPGPEDAAGFRWLQRLGAGLGRGLPQATAMRVQALGGPDGVTAANRFATEAEPDGRNLLAFAPGAAQARLIGDARAKYDCGTWLAVCGGIQAAALLVRRQLAPGAALRVAMIGPEAPEAAALLALDLLGRTVTPVLAPLPEAAFATGAADAFIASGPGLAARARALDAEILFAAEPGAGGRDPLLPEVPILPELRADLPAAPLPALRAALTACRLRALLVLPALTPSDAVAAFRQAAQHWQEESGREGMEEAIRLIGPAEGARIQAQLTVSAEACAGYRDWLRRRTGWRAA